MMITHEPIHIKGNDEFAKIAKEEGWAGNGTKHNPYIIENLEINSKGGYCIDIASVDVYFVIRNCKLHGAKYIEEHFLSGHGLVLVGTKNGIISNNTLISNEYSGIHLIYSSNNIITNNNCISNDRKGIYLYKSPNNIIINNTCILNGDNGIELSENDNNNILINNTCVSNGDRGIELCSTKNSILINNTCISNRMGIKWSYGTNLIITNNKWILNDSNGYENSTHIYIKNLETYKTYVIYENKQYIAKSPYTIVCRLSYLMNL